MTVWVFEILKCMVCSRNRSGNVNGSSVGSNVVVGNAASSVGMGVEGAPGSHLQMMLQSAAMHGAARAYPPPPPPAPSLHYANAAPHPIYNNQAP